MWQCWNTGNWCCYFWCEVWLFSFRAVIISITLVRSSRICSMWNSKHCGRSHWLARINGGICQSKTRSIEQISNSRLKWWRSDGGRGQYALARSENLLHSSNTKAWRNWLSRKSFGWSRFCGRSDGSSHVLRVSWSTANCPTYRLEFTCCRWISSIDWGKPRSYSRSNKEF